MKNYLDRNKEPIAQTAPLRLRIYAYLLDLIFGRLIGLIFSIGVILVANHLFLISGAFNDFDLELMQNIPLASLSPEVRAVTLAAFYAKIVGAVVFWISEVFIGATITKLIFSIRVMNMAGQRASAGQLFFRWIFKNSIFIILSALLVFEVQIDVEKLTYFLAGFYIINGVLMLFPARQSLHDLIAGTSVFKEPKSVAGPERIERIDSERRDPSDLLRPRW